MAVITGILTKQEAATLASYIDQLEAAIEQYYRTVTNFFAEGTPMTKRSMLTTLVDTTKLWGDRPTSLLDKLMAEKEETEDA